VRAAFATKKKEKYLNENIKINSACGMLMSAENIVKGSNEGN